MSDNSFLEETLAQGVLKVTLEGGVAHVLSQQMICALQEMLDRVKQSQDVKVLLLHGPGKIFCAGHDLKEMRRHRQDRDQGRNFAENLFSACSQMMTDLARLPLPTLCALEGVSTAGGLQLMASCDLVFAGAGATFSLPGVNNNGFCTTPSVAVGRRIARTHVMEMALSGLQFDADWALRTGLINQKTEAGTALAVAESFANQLAQRHAPAVQLGKTMLDQQLTLPLPDAYAAATPLMVEHFMDPVRITKEAQDWS